MIINELFKLVAQNDPEAPARVREFLIKNQSLLTEQINRRIHNKSVAAHAAQFGKLETFIGLIENDLLDINTQENEFSLIYWASLNPSLDILTYIMQHHDLLTRLQDDTSELHVLSFNGNLEAIRELTNRDSSLLSQVDKNGHSALFYAALRAHFPILEYFRSILPESEAHHHADSIARGYGILAWNSAKFDEAKMALEALTKKNRQDYYYLALCAEQLVGLSGSIESDIKIFETYFLLLTHNIDEVVLPDEYRALSKRLLTIKQSLHAQARAMTPPSPTTNHQKLLIAAIRRAQECGFDCSDVANDGSCFFHVVFEQVKHLKVFEKWLRTPTDLRTKAVEHLNNFKADYQTFFSDDIDLYLKKAQDYKTWADEYLILALSRRLGLNLVIFSIHSDSAPQIFKQEGACETVYLINIENLHFLSLRPVKNKHDRGLYRATIDKLLEETPNDDFFTKHIHRLPREDSHTVTKKRCQSSAACTFFNQNTRDCSSREQLIIEPTLNPTT